MKNNIPTLILLVVLLQGCVAVPVAMVAVGTYCDYDPKCNVSKEIVKQYKANSD
jgi:hypothetical protein